MLKFIAIDWGTSQFRAHLININGDVLQSKEISCSIGNLTQSEQVKFIIEQTSDYQNEDNSIEYVICGMPGSNIGLQHVAYIDCPFEPTLLAERVVQIESPLINGWLVPGLRCESHWGEMDMLRGEECQILGWYTSLAKEDLDNLSTDGASTLCLPGTHTKWVQYQNQQVHSFNTSITGELYNSLLQFSILSRGEQTFDENSFRQAVTRTSQGEALTEMLFTCRSRVLSGDMKAEHSASYLSGLIIGCEVAAQLAKTNSLQEQSIYIIGNQQLAKLYQTALDVHQINSTVLSGSDMVTSGLTYLYQQINDST